MSNLILMQNVINLINFVINVIQFVINFVITQNLINIITFVIIQNVKKNNPRKMLNILQHKMFQILSNVKFQINAILQNFIKKAIRYSNNNNARYCNITCITLCLECQISRIMCFKLNGYKFHYPANVKYIKCHTIISYLNAKRNEFD